MSKFSTLVYGELDDVEAIVDAAPLNEAEVRAVLLNLIRRVREVERVANRFEKKEKP